jgi:hypothetical protein
VVVLLYGKADVFEGTTDTAVIVQGASGVVTDSMHPPVLHQINLPLNREILGSSGII